MTPKWETRIQSLEVWGTSGLKDQVDPRITYKGD